jgi:hypothetical protein
VAKAAFEGEFVGADMAALAAAADSPPTLLPLPAWGLPKPPLPLTCIIDGELLKLLLPAAPLLAGAIAETGVVSTAVGGVFVPRSRGESDGPAAPGVKDGDDGADAASTAGSCGRGLNAPPPPPADGGPPSHVAVGGRAAEQRP